MGRIFREGHTPSTAEKFGQAFANVGQSLGQALPQHLLAKEQKQNQLMQMQQENAALLKQGIDLGGITDPKARQELISSNLQGNRQREQNQFLSEENDRKFRRDIESLANKTSQENREKVAPYIGALNTVHEMRKLGKGGNLGFGSSVLGLASEEGRRDRANYSQLGKSLIQFASTIPIRNQKEFETLAHDLYDPTINDAAREGILNAIEKIIMDGMGQYTDVGSTGGQGRIVPVQGRDGQTYNIPEELMEEFMADQGV